MDINRKAPATAAGEIQIAAGPETVWDVLTDINGWPRWNADVKSARMEGPLAVGSTFRWKSGLASLTSTFQAVEPPSEIGWTGTTMSIKAVHVFRLEPRDGGTFVRSEESWEGFIASMLKGYSHKNIQSAISSILAGLKREAESRSQA
jgi:uncharacterized protein YndB with AHSA1/START domain